MLNKINLIFLSFIFFICHFNLLASNKKNNLIPPHSHSYSPQFPKGNFSDFTYKDMVPKLRDSEDELEKKGAKLDLLLGLTSSSLPNKVLQNPEEKD